MRMRYQQLIKEPLRMWVCLCVLGFSSSFLMAQPNIQESIQIHTDQSFYMSGDRIYLKLYVRDALARKISRISKLSYVELWDESGKLVLQTKVLLKEGMGAASLELPIGQSTGLYRLRAYTKWMVNEGAHAFAQEPILVFNPRQPIPVRDSVPANLGGGGKTEHQSFSTKTNPSSSEQLKIGIQLSQEMVGQREQLILEIETKDLTGKPVSASLSLGVAKNIPSNLVPLSLPDTSGRPSSPPLESLILPDLYGISLNGWATNSQGEKVPNARVFVALPGKTPVVHLSRSNQEGYFSILLPDVYGNREIVLGAHDSLDNPLQLQLESDIMGANPPPHIPFSFSPEHLPFLEDYVVQAQLKQAYQAATLQAKRVELPELSPFFHAADEIYELEAFTRFDMEETFHEIIYSVLLRKRKGEWSFRVHDVNSSRVQEEAPLVMVDGVPTTNVSAILEMNSKEVDKIEVLTSVFYLNQEKLHGILHIVSKEGDAREIPLADSFVRRPYAFFSPSQAYPIGKPAESEEGHMPDLRTLLFWEPNLQTEENGKVRLTIDTSDILGEFVIRLTGMDAAGNWGEQRAILKVQASHRE